MRDGKTRQSVNDYSPMIIQDTLNKVKDTACLYCDRKGAAVKCHTCRHDFHLPCGLNNGSVSHFFKRNLSYCHLHRPKQPRIHSESSPVKCGLCLEEIPKSDDFYYRALFARCCKKNWYHRFCLMKRAQESDYSFVCPGCNDKNEFQRIMATNGVWIGMRDYPKLEKPLYCDTPNCFLVYGRAFVWDCTPWELIECNNCGVRRTHLACAGIEKPDLGWKCQLCVEVQPNAIIKKLPVGDRLSSRVRVKKFPEADF